MEAVDGDDRGTSVGGAVAAVEESALDDGGMIGVADVAGAAIVGDVVGDGESVVAVSPAVVLHAANIANIASVVAPGRVRST